MASKYADPGDYTCGVCWGDGSRESLDSHEQYHGIRDTCYHCCETGICKEPNCPRCSGDDEPRGYGYDEDPRDDPDPEWHESDDLILSDPRLNDEDEYEWEDEEDVNIFNEDELPF